MTCEKPKLYKHLRNYQFRIIIIIIINSHGLYGNTGHLLGTFSHHILWNLTLFPQEVKGLLEECAQEESNYHYINCMKRVRAQIVHCEMK